jgi:hypothetical protein
VLIHFLILLENAQVSGGECDYDVVQQDRATRKLSKMYVAELKGYLEKVLQKPIKKNQDGGNACKSDWLEQLKAWLWEECNDDGDRPRIEAFLGDMSAAGQAKYDHVFHEGYNRNEHVVARAKGFVKLARWLLPEFEHVEIYDNAPSHKKKPGNAADVNSIAMSDGCGKVLRMDTTWNGRVQKLTMPDPNDSTKMINKGLLRIGNERGHWDMEGRIMLPTFGPLHRLPGGGDLRLEPQMKKLQKPEMADFLAQDPDFERCKSILEEFYDGESGFHYVLLPKFWCNFAWVENYWNDCKRITREQCDYTLPNLKRTFPLALETACPPDFIRNYMRKCQRLFWSIVQRL